MWSEPGERDGLQGPVEHHPLPNRPTPTIPAKAGIHGALIWIPAFAGMVGVLRSGGNGENNMSLNRP